MQTAMIPAAPAVPPATLGPAAGIVALAGIFGGLAGVIVALAVLGVIFVVLSVSRR